MAATAPSPPNWQQGRSPADSTNADKTDTAAPATKFTSRWRPSAANRVLPITSAAASVQPLPSGV